jgi:ketosteroid isomerase-like protein
MIEHDDLTKGQDMDLKDIAEALVAANRTHSEAALLTAHYAEDVVSVEAMDHGNGRETHGIDALRAKHAWWEENMEVTASTVSEPMLHAPDRFAVIFEASGRARAGGETFEMREIGLYTVTAGKIVREEFFY